MRPFPLIPLAPLAALVAALSACADDPQQTCNGGKCDAAGDAFTGLDGRNDPIAKYLREAGIDDNGVVSADYGSVILGVAAAQGCSADTWRTFVISDPLVTTSDPFPRLISTVCSNDAVKASEFFIAASFPDDVGRDVHPRRLEMFAWDGGAGVYRFYAAEPTAGDPASVTVEVEPAECQRCHLTPKDLPSAGMRMTPIMSELTQPWSHWNSQVPMFNAEDNPFPSHDFEVPEAVRTAENFVRYGVMHAGAAADFEQIVRAGHARVVGERVKERRGTAADFRPAMNLLRPLFCEEQLQYATEDFSTGLLQVTTVIPGGVREAYRAIRADNWPWRWLNNQDGRMRLPPPASIGPLTMVPLRGNVDIEYESRLLGVRALTPNQILRVRALDWQRPVLSSFRCGLWKKALARFEASPPALDLSGKIGDHMKVLLDEVLTVNGTPISAGDPERFVALGLAGADADAVLSAAGGVAATCTAPGQPCVVDVDTFGALLDAYVATYESGDPDQVRVHLTEQRDERLCVVARQFPSAPHLPDLACGAAGDN